ncbi:TonB-dependent receptor [Paracoccus aestuarii]|uniref:TonB-dependent receptor n=1 Tax=Paracoccus aestuarii TaxID=453842 RepID=A0A418ZSN3_9RHOB|nr:TonB-dependent receptor [Paracoccus aestuarii]RJK99499.1 TonB-dependent receptor [Paracoccus aestuarii]WCR01122.1 TonB-dependent receptor [Paracoccus aestuarii]
MRRPLSILALAAALPTAALSQEGQPVLLDGIVISGGLAPVPQQGFARAHTVIEGDEIRRRGLVTVQEALRGLPGLSVSSSGNLTQLRVRGGDGRHVLVLIDGIEAVGGGDEYFFSGLDTDHVERIEVLRGPQSVAYGSNASTGVVNIITRRAEPGRAAGGRVELGNGGAASAWVTQRGDRGGVALTLSAREDRGFDQSGDGGGRDGTNRRTIGLSGDFAATPDLRFGTVLRRSTETIGRDVTDFFASDAAGYVVDADLIDDRDEFQGGIWAELAPEGAALSHRIDLQQTIEKRRPADDVDSRGETVKLKYRATLGLDGSAADARQVVSLLAERQRDTNTFAQGRDRRMGSVALEYRAALDGGLDLQAGLRRDRNREFADFTSWTVAGSWQVPDRPLRLHASAGTGLVSPSFIELFGGFGTIGNPDLRPEINRSIDIGIETQLAGGIIDLTWFRERLDHEIEFFVTDAGAFSYRNRTGRSPREGVELSGRIAVTDALTLGGSYTYLDARDPGGATEIRRPRHEAAVSASLALLEGRADLSGDLRHVSGLRDTEFWLDGGTVTVPSFTVANVAAGYDLTPRVRATARVVNLFDRDYSEVIGYASRGRTAYAGLQARW